MSQPQGNGHGSPDPMADVTRSTGAFTERQGNGERMAYARATPYVRQNQVVDQISPRRPGDPPWRHRTARRSSTPEAMSALRRGRLDRGWSMTVAAERSGVSRPMISQLESGQRRPSRPLAEALISTYRLTGADADAVRSIALERVGRDSPYRTGVSPDGEPSDTSWDTEGNGLRQPDRAAQHQPESGTDRATGRPAATADDWIAWARRKSEQAQAAQRTG